MLGRVCDVPVSALAWPVSQPDCPLPRLFIEVGIRRRDACVRRNCFLLPHNTLPAAVRRTVGRSAVVKFVTPPPTLATSAHISSRPALTARFPRAGIFLSQHRARVNAWSSKLRSVCAVRRRLLVGFKARLTVSKFLMPSAIYQCRTIVQFISHVTL